MWLCLFVLHLEEVVSRRGCLGQLFSDNGTNFVGAANEIQQLQDVESNKHDISLPFQASALGIRWNFKPPRAPQFGGLWEAAVKCAEKHLHRTMGNSVLAFEELTTIFCQIEAVLISRPISVMSDDPNDVELLTPAHLSIRHGLDVLPSFLLDQAHDVDNCSPSKSYSEHYVAFLEHMDQRISNHITDNLKVGDLVFITDDNLAPLQWPYGCVHYVYNEPDSSVRVVKMKTPTGIYNCPVHKLKKLPIDT